MSDSEELYTEDSNVSTETEDDTDFVSEDSTTDEDSETSESSESDDDSVSSMDEDSKMDLGRKIIERLSNPKIRQTAVNKLSGKKDTSVRKNVKK